MLFRNSQACFRKLSVQIGFYFLKADRRREGMTLADEVMQVVIEMVAISGHEVGPSISRLLKKAASGVLAALRGSTYCREYASPLRLLRPCWTAFLNSLRWLLNGSVSIRA